MYFENVLMIDIMGKYLTNMIVSMKFKFIFV